MQEVIKEYIEYLKATKKLSDNTLQAYRRDINKYQVYLESNSLDYLKQDNEGITEYINSMKLQEVKPATISRSLATLRSFYSYLEKENKIELNPTVTVEAPKIEKKIPTILTSDEIEVLLSQPKTDDLKGI